MATAQLTKVIAHLRNVLGERNGAEQTDGELLRRYVRLKEEAAFEILVRRHGAMVMGVCRRVLRNPHDAEDAFQATFLVLVRKAATLRNPGLIGNWLYGVAYRTALEAKSLAAKRKVKEANVAALPSESECVVQMSEDPKSAPTAHFNGTLKVAPKTWRIVNRASRLVENQFLDLGSLLPGSLKKMAGKEMMIESTLPKSLNRAGEPTRRRQCQVDVLLRSMERGQGVTDHL